MRSSILAVIAAYTGLASSALTYTLHRAPNPTQDQLDAYGRIDASMRLAVDRHNRQDTSGLISKRLNVYYAPGVPTAEANYNGDVRFGTNRAFMSERTALHEVSHTLGVGQTAAFDRKCAAGDWATALPLLRSWDGQGAVINCGGGHVWPYGLNFENEWSELNAQRNVQMVQAMIRDGM